MSETQIKTVESLEEAFLRFRDASSRLQSKYDMLLTETAALRTRLSELEEQRNETEEGQAPLLLGNVAGALAHEVRNPLGAIKLFLSLLKDDCKAVPSSMELLSQIETSVGSIELVIDNMLHLTSEKPLEFAPINLGATLLDVVNQHRMIYPHIELHPEGLEETVFTLAHEHALRQVFTNLFRNALEAIGSKQGEMWIRLSNESQPVVEIEDSGGGIPEEILSRVFDPFVSSKNEGTGLGLAITKRLLLKHGAAISASNTEHGAKFRIEFRGCIRG